MSISAEMAATGLGAGLFTLGSVQFGQAYGLAATQPNPDEVMAILDRAQRAGVIWIDTARAYGSAEDCIGQWVLRNGKNFRIVSKIRPLTGAADNLACAEMESSLAESLRMLGIPSVDICLMHRASDLLRPGMADGLRGAAADGRIKLFGASVYTQEELTSLFDVEDLGAIQLPMNVVSTGFRDSGLIDKLAKRGVIIFVRSVFLQGALLMQPERLPAHLSSLSPVIVKLRSIAADAGISLPALLIGAIKSVEGVWSPVLGTDSLRQLEELVAASQRQALPDHVVEAAFDAGRHLPISVTNPRFWPKGNSA